MAKSETSLRLEVRRKNSLKKEKKRKEKKEEFVKNQPVQKPTEPNVKFNATL